MTKKKSPKKESTSKIYSELKNTDRDELALMEKLERDLSWSYVTGGAGVFGLALYFGGLILDQVICINQNHKDLDPSCATFNTKPALTLAIIGFGLSHYLWHRNSPTDRKKILDKYDEENYQKDIAEVNRRYGRK